MKNCPDCGARLIIKRKFGVVKYTCPKCPWKDTKVR